MGGWPKFFFIIAYTYLAVQGAGICRCDCERGSCVCKCGNAEEITVNSPLSSSSQFSHPSSSVVIQSHKVTNWGKWMGEVVCPAGTYAIAFSVIGCPFSEVMYTLSGHDKLGVVGFNMYCGEPGSYLPKKILTIVQPKTHGHTYKRTIHRCLSGLFNGFNLQVQEPQGKSDDQATTSIRMLCTDPKIGAITSIGTDEGSFGKADVTCPKKMAICGFDAQIEQQGSGLDSSAVNNIKMRCCNLPDPARHCIPSDDWAEVMSCENLGSKKNISCVYEYKTGVEKSSVISETTQDSFDAVATAGATFSPLFGDSLGLGFSTNLATSRKTGVAWDKQKKEAFSESKVHKLSMTVPPRVGYVLKQAQGKCGPFIVGSAVFKLDHYNISGSIVRSSVLSSKALLAL